MTTLLDALAALRPGSAFTMAPGDFATLRWQDPDHDQPTLDAVLAKQAELEAEARIDAVKAEARRRITQRFPDWKQANMTARGVELLNGPMDRPWGVRTATFRDPAGHVWEIGA